MMSWASTSRILDPDKPLHVSAVPEEIDWDNLPDDIIDEMLALMRRIMALQPSSGGLVIDENGASVEPHPPRGVTST